MEYHISSELLFAAACLIFIFSGIFCGITRWIHMCKPYDENGEYFYPGRKQATFFFAAIVMQFPYLLNPMDAGTWMYIRVFGILYYPMCFSLLFKRYFAKERLKRNNRNAVYFYSSFLAVGFMLISVLTGNGALFMDLGSWFLALMGLLSVLLTIGYFRETQRIKKNIEMLNEEDYSNYEDFPYYFAKRVYYSPLVWIAIMWIMLLADSHWFKFYTDIVLAFWMIYFLNVILHPQKFFSNSRQKEKQEQMQKQISDIVNNYVNHREDDSENDSGDNEVENDNSTDVIEYSEEVKDEVINVILQKFRDPHLKKSDVLSEISEANRKDANRFIIHVGYYNLVNCIRLKYAVYYANLKPKATRNEVAVASGFSSRFGLNNVSRKEIVINPRIMDNIKFDLAD